MERGNVAAEEYEILLVEDNLGDAELIALALAESSDTRFQLTRATNLAEGMEQARTGEFQLVLLDLGLPDSQGLDTFTDFRAGAPHMPFIVLTGLDDTGIGLRAVQAGAQDFLVKGNFSSQLLVRAIRYAMEREDARRRIQLLNQELEQRVAERTRELEASNRALQQANEELKDLDRMKTSFIRVATHELTTPVQVMGGMLGILSMLPPAKRERWQEAVSISLKGAERLQNMVARVLEVAQAGSYRQSVRRDLVEPAQLVRQVRDQVAPFAAMRNLTLRLDLAATLPPVAMNSAQN